MILPPSFLSAASNVTRFRTRAVKDDTRRDVRLKEELLEKLKSEAKKLESDVAVQEQDLQYIKRLEGFTATTVTDRALLEKELAAAREDGYAVCVGELEDSLYGASAAVLSEQGRPLAVVSVWGPERRVPKARLAAIGELTAAAAAQIRELLR